MKQFLTFSLALLFSFLLYAQPPRHMDGPRHKEAYPNIEKLVSNLTSNQKKRIETITDNTKKEVAKLSSELESIRQQIKNLHDKSGDQSSLLFPLFDQESHYMAQISKEMYKCRVLIDEVLTPEQVKELHQSLEAERQKQMKNHSSRHPEAKKTKPDTKKTAVKKA